MLVNLRPRRLHGRAFARVQRPILNPISVRAFGDFAAKRVHFLDKVAFRQTADRRVARHRADIVGVDREHERFAAHPGAYQRRLAARMPRPHDNYVIFFIINSHIFL